MKKIFVSLIAFILAFSFAGAVPADPKPYKYVQPDGSVIVLQNHGDEFFHWTTDAAGRIVEKGADGFYRVSNTSLEQLAAKAATRQNQTISRAWSSYENPPETNFGDRKVLCLIANFSDSTFVVPDPNQHFSDMLNKPGYDYNGAIGSVRDYYIDNSNGQYRPEFDVFGPVDLANSSKYYDDNGVYLAIMEAYELLKDQFNINDYDTDNDGSIDMVLFYYPGHNEAEGGGEESIWPHQGTGYYGMLGEKSLRRYFCTSELQGSAGTVPAAIGTTCHEFAHSLGLPDFYDTDYSGSGGQNNTTGPFDLMTQGNYNDNGRRPPYLNALERNMLGWMDYPVLISASGNFTLEAIQNDKAYQLNTGTPGEYFILESRNGNKWDSYLPDGLLLYHVDKSNRVVNGRTAAEWWQGNKINANGGHPCFRLISGVNKPTSWNQYIFPGAGNVQTFAPVDWDGNEIGISLSNIAVISSGSSFTVTASELRQLNGYIKDTDGNPLKGVEVSLTPSEVPFGAPAYLSGSITGTTDENGYFALELPISAVASQILQARKDGYVPVYANLTISSLFTQQNFTLLKIGEAVPADLSRYDSSLDLYYWNLGTGDIAVGMYYSPEELSAMKVVGTQVQKVSFFGGAGTGATTYVLVDIDGEVPYRKDVSAVYKEGEWVTVDISDANIRIEDGKGIHIGYGFKDIPDGDFCFPAYCYSSDEGGSCAIGNFLDENSSWGPVSSGSGYLGFMVSAILKTSADIEFSNLGVSYIKLKADVPTVVVAAGKSLRSTTWYLDGAAVATPPAVSSLSSGAHTYMVRLLYYDGTAERVYYDVTK